MGRPRLIEPNVLVRFKLVPHLYHEAEDRSRNINSGQLPYNWQQTFWTALTREWALTLSEDLPGIGPVRAAPEVLARLKETLHGKD